MTFFFFVVALELKRELVRGRRIPQSLRIFMLSLAVVDDAMGIEGRFEVEPQ